MAMVRSRSRRFERREAELAELEEAEEVEIAEREPAPDPEAEPGSEAEVEDEVRTSGSESVQMRAGGPLGIQVRGELEAPGLGAPRRT